MSKISNVKAAFAATLNKHVKDVHIVSIVEVALRRRRLQSTGIKITYEVKVETSAAATNTIIEMADTNFVSRIKTNLAAAVGVPENSLSVTTETPTVSDASMVLATSAKSDNSPKDQSSGLHLSVELGLILIAFALVALVAISFFLSSWLICCAKDKKAKDIGGIFKLPGNYPLVMEYKEIQAKLSKAKSIHRQAKESNDAQAVSDAKGEVGLLEEKLSSVLHQLEEEVNGRRKVEEMLKKGTSLVITKSEGDQFKRKNIKLDALSGNGTAQGQTEQAGQKQSFDDECEVGVDANDVVVLGDNIVETGAKTGIEYKPKPSSLEGEPLDFLPPKFRKKVKKRRASMAI